MSNLIHLSLVNASYRDAFASKVISISASLGIDPNWLMQVMKSESGLNPQAKNKSKIDGHVIAAGLIQWTAASGQLPAFILTQSALQQLDYVQKYFAPFSGKMHSYFDVYLVTFFPAAVGKPDTYVFQTSRYSPALIASQNPAINRNNDQKITMAEFKEYVTSTVPVLDRPVVFNKSLLQSIPSTTLLAVVGGIVAIFLLK